MTMALDASSGTRTPTPPGIRFDPVAEGNHHRLSREVSLAIWERVCAEASDSAGGDRSSSRLGGRFHDIAARIAGPWRTNCTPDVRSGHPRGCRGQQVVTRGVGARGSWLPARPVGERWLPTRQRTGERPSDVVLARDVTDASGARPVARRATGGKRGPAHCGGGAAAAARTARSGRPRSRRRSAPG